MPRVELTLDDLQSLPSTFHATIPADYLDDMGHMNVMWYTHLFSEAMGGFFATVGMSWDEIIKQDAGTFALESHIRYFAEVRVDQEVRIRSRVLGRSEKRFHVLHFMWNESKNNLAAVFEVVGAFMDMKIRKMAPMPEDVCQNMDRLIEAHTKLPWSPPICGSMAP